MPITANSIFKTWNPFSPTRLKTGSQNGIAICWHCKKQNKTNWSCGLKNLQQEKSGNP